MQKQVRLSRFISVIILTAVFIHACSTNSPVSVGSTSTPTASSGSSQNNVISTSTAAELVPSALPAAQTINACSFFTAKDAEALAGTALTDMGPGSDVDEITGDPTYTCLYHGDEINVFITLLKSSAAKDSKELQGQFTSADPSATTSPAPGIGEQAYWAVTEDGYTVVVLRYPYILSLGVGGNMDKLGNLEDYKDNLKALAQNVLDGLQ